jgi:hypothetical protein
VDDAAGLYAAGRLDDAVAACRAALDLEPELVPARSLLGMVEEERGNPGAALAEFEAVARLDPSRTVERDRAVRLRAQLSSQVAAPLEFDDPSRTRRRLVPILAAVGVGLIVLVVGAVVSGRNARSQTGAPVVDANNLGNPGQGWGQGGADAGQYASDQTQLPSTTGPSPFPPSPIEPTIRDQSASQPPLTDSGTVSQNGGGGGGGAPPVVTDVEPIPMPPPTVTSDRGTGPLTIPNTPAPTRGRIVAPEPPPAPPARAPRGKVRIWLGDDDGPAPSPGASAPAPAPGPEPSRSGAGNSSLLRPSGGGGGGGSAAIPGGPRAQTSWGGQQATAMAAQGRGGNTGPSYASRTWSAPASSGGPRAIPGQARGNSGGGTPTARRGGYSAPNSQFPAPTASPVRSANAGSARPSGPSAESLRSQAQQAWTAGRVGDARSMYRSAIRSYEQESQGNSGRANVNRSAIQSCQRALDALDAGR